MAIGAGGLFVLAFFILVTPEVVEDLVTHTPNWFYLPVIIVMYAAALPFYFALYHTFTLLHFIDAGTAFSQHSVKALKNIKYAAIIIGALYGGIVPLLYILAKAADAPGVLAIGLVLSGTAFVVALFAAVLQSVLRSAIAMKKEHDLTV